MSSLKSLTTKELLSQTEYAVQNERSVTAEVVRLFEEIESRKLHLQMGFPSLFEMATKHFGYCAGAAQRRINSMRLIRELPEVEQKIESGELSLTAAATLQGFFAGEKREKKSYSRQEKLDVVKSCLNKSTREIERELATLSPNRDKRDSITFINEDRVRMSVTISDELHTKINRLKAIWSHSNPGLSTEILLERVIDMALDRVDPAKAYERYERKLNVI